MTIKHDIEWLDAIINDPKACHGNLEDNNKALSRIKKLLEILKKHLFKGAYETEDGEVYQMICLIALTTETAEREDFEIIKRWIDNEN